MLKGFFITLEGIDGSGKTTAAKLLADGLRKSGANVFSIKFPRHGHPSAWAADEYLNGRFGKADELGPYVPEIFYALDRFAASKEIRKALETGAVVIADRYVGSGLAHLGSNLPDLKKRRAYMRWAEHLEYTLFGIPKPDLTIILDIPAKLAQTLIAQKQRRSYIRRGKRDINERDMRHLMNTAAVYRSLSRRPKHVLIDVAPKGQLLPIAEVHERIWKYVRTHYRT